MAILLHNTYNILKRKAKEKIYKRKFPTPQIQSQKRSISSPKIRKKKNLAQNSTPLPLIAEDSDNEDDQEGPSLRGLIGRRMKQRIQKNIELQTRTQDTNALKIEEIGKQNVLKFASISTAM